MSKSNITLFKAIRANHIDIVRKELERGIDPNESDYLNVTPLHWALKKRRYEIIRLLVAHGADINRPNKMGQYLIELAYDTYHDQEGFALLIELNARIDVPSYVQHKLFIDRLVYNNHGYYHYINIYVAQGRDVNILDGDGNPLFFRIQNITTLESMISNGLDIHRTNKYGENVISYLSEPKYFTYLKFFVSLGVNLNHQNNYGMLPLQKCILCGWLEMVKFLIANGANLQERSLSGDTFIHPAAKRSEPEFVTYLHSIGANLNVLNQNGVSPLCVAIQEKNDKTAFKLIELGANVDLTKPGIFGMLPIHYAMRTNNVLLTKTLIPLQNRVRYITSQYYVDIGWNNFDIIDMLWNVGVNMVFPLSGDNQVRMMRVGKRILYLRSNETLQHKCFRAARIIIDLSEIRKFIPPIVLKSISNDLL